MKFGVLVMPQVHPGTADNIARRWSEVLDLARLAEDVGFDGVFLPEHHMMDDGYPPNPLIGCAAIAAVTERVEIGTTIHLLPFYHPIHTAEAAATIDVMSRGRMRLGVGMGNFDPEFELFGLNPKTQVSRFEEGIEVIQQAWSGQPIDHDGKHFTIKAEKVQPQPVGAQMWIGAMSDGGVRRAARFGLPWAADPLHNVHVMRRWKDLYEQEYANHGHETKPQTVLLRKGWVSNDLATAKQVWWPHIQEDHWFYFSQVPRFVTDLEPTLQDIKSKDDFTFETHHPERLVVGSPQQCIESIEAFRQELDPDYLVMQFRPNVGPDYDQEFESVRRFGEEVIPHFT